MYVTGKHRYDNYTSRYDVYLFTLRDWTEVMIDKYQGRYIDRSDMPLHTGYLMEFVGKIDEAVAFIKSIAESVTEVSEDVTTFVLPHLEGNELPIYATVAKDIDYIYVGMSEYPEALDALVDKKN